MLLEGVDCGSTAPVTVVTREVPEFEGATNAALPFSLGLVFLFPRSRPPRFVLFLFAFFSRSAVNLNRGHTRKRRSGQSSRFDSRN